MVAAFELFGHSLPNPGIALVIIVLMVGFFLINRADPGTGEQVGTGIEHECPRCGTHYQPERVELLDTGDTRRSYDDRCPHCGWDYKRGDPDRHRNTT